MFAINFCIECEQNYGLCVVMGNLNFAKTIVTNISIRFYFEFIPKKEKMQENLHLLLLGKCEKQEIILKALKLY